MEVTNENQIQTSKKKLNQLKEILVQGLGIPVVYFSIISALHSDSGIPYLELNDHNITEFYWMEHRQAFWVKTTIHQKMPRQLVHLGELGFEAIAKWLYSEYSGYTQWDELLSEWK